jgi:gliding motility-associated-like protein
MFHTHLFTFIIVSLPGFFTNTSLEITPGRDLLVENKMDPPVVQNDTVSSRNQAQVIIQPLLNDFDPDGDSLRLTAISIAPRNGVASISGTEQIFYTPEIGFTGFDSLNYEVTDQEGLTQNAWVFIEIIAPDVDILPDEIFTPGISGAWFIDKISDFPTNEVKIFNRWGNLIYATKAYNNSSNFWDGKANAGGITPGSQNVPDGTYFYVIKLDPSTEGVVKGAVVVNSGR